MPPPQTPAQSWDITLSWEQWADAGQAGQSELPKDSCYSQESTWGLRNYWLFVGADSSSSISKSTKPRPNFLASFPTQNHAQSIFAISKEKRVINITIYHTANTTCFKNIISKFPSESGLGRKWSHPIYLAFSTYCKLWSSLMIISLFWLLRKPDYSCNIWWLE